MKAVLICAAALVSVSSIANAQTAPAAGTPAPAAAAAAAPAATAAVTIDSPIEAIAATPAGKASFEKNMPELLPHPAYEQFKGMTLRDLAPLSGGTITDEKIAAVDADLKAAAAKK